ncbi:1-phosphatidylinositol 4,5-bisphosphate phosphodiesterase beta-1 [Gossypium australe]|uniref:1-phosphatidylinositol 4,5-bisphosphate phosphodiesterase beta-1 n=1 Tax=Gossypium australe TaxID=47621 RepID=A0A5B6UU98_9ROSI|nr:1-phosphatidylinositol 4,5-bisphosphate phosphodiesterase beta-1 [Gossypium australe]
MATIVLSTLLKTHAGRQPRDKLIAFWSPFVLWYLGDPYNITAYSLEDNAQWLRYFIGFVLQVGEHYSSGARHPALIFIACPILMAGFVKYGQKIWAL